jgi:hypothetical protein
MRASRMPATLLAVTLSATPSRGQSPEDSIVRVFAGLRLPNPVPPWAKQKDCLALDHDFCAHHIDGVAGPTIHPFPRTRR